MGPVGDAGWTWAHDQGRQFAAEATGVETAFVEMVPEGTADFGNYVRDFIGQGYNVIFGTSFGYMDDMLALADEYPDVVFEHISGYKANDTNFGNTFGRMYEPRYLSGMVAGSATSSNLIGYVAAFPIPEVIRGINAFTLGVREVNPDAQVEVNWTSTWFDPAVEGDSAQALLDKGADVIAMHQDSTAAGQAAEAAGARWVSYNSDMSAFAPEAYLTAPVWDWGPRYVEIIESAQAGTYTPGYYWGSMADGVVDLAPIAADVDSGVKDQVLAAKEAIIAGDLHPFTGPLYDQAGNLVLADGETMDDGTMLGMGFFVQGVIGSTGAEEEAAPAGDLCVGLVTDVGEVDDKSFNQSAWEGAQLAASELGASVDYIETQAAKDYAANIGLFADSGCDVIITVGFALGEATAIAAAEYPDVDFIGVDQWQAEAIPNVAGLLFPEDQAGFLAGALAASMSKTGIIAEVLGTDLVPPVVAFGEGYVNGAKHINPNIQVIKTYHPGGLDVAFTDPEWGATTARQALDQGADVIFGAGGKTGNGALIEVAGEPGALCIGVDTDQWNTVPEAHSCLVSSAMKLIVPGVFDLIQQSHAGSMPSGNYYGEVGLAEFHDFDSMVPADVQSMLVDMAADLKSGTLLACVWQDCPTEIATDYGVTDDTIRVGAIGDLSGPFAPLVKFIVDAQTVYWDMVNRDGGIAGRQVEFVVRDSGYDVPTHLEHWEELTDDNGVVMISQSTGSPHTSAIAESAIEKNIAVIPLSWYSGWPDPEFGLNIFESTSNYCYEAINGVDFLNEHVAAQTGIAAPTMAIIGMPGDYGQDGSAGAWIAAEALGIEVVADLEGTVAPGADNTGALSQLVAAGADMVWATVSPTVLAELVGGAAAQGYVPWWSGNVPSYNPALLDTAVGPVLDTNYILNSYLVTWNTEGIPGLDKMKEELLAAVPDLILSDSYIQGWIEGQAAHQALVRAAANGDLTRAGVVAAFNQITVDHEGLAPNQSWGGGDPNDTVVRESYSFDIVLDNYTSGATIAEGGDTGSVLLRGPWVSDILSLIHI